MKKIIIVLLILLLGGSIFMYKHMDENNKPNNITINYEDSLYFPTTLEESKYDLVDLSTLDTNLTFSLRYATTDNFAGEQFYPKIAKPYLLENTAKKLVAANEELYSLGYRIKIFDAYRPNRYQYLLRDAAERINPATKGYIANPKTGSNHNRGASVDITLTDLEGHELAMPTGFDFFGPEASIYYNGCTEEEKNNRELLGKVMQNNGFRRISSEWWHFDDVDYLDYPILDIDFDELN